MAILGLTGCKTPGSCEFNKVDLEKYGKRLVLLEKGPIKLGILPDLGGRCVYLSHNGAMNIILAEPDQWLGDFKKPDLSEGYFGYNGHSTWVGPQSDWWSQQNVNKDRLLRKAIWPPDPFTIYARYEILKQTKSFVRMKAPMSPVTGLVMTKEFEIQDDGKIRVFVDAVNNSKRTVSWDLWLNTRVRPQGRAFVPVDKKRGVKFVFDGKFPFNSRPLGFSIHNGWFCFDNERPIGKKRFLSGKVYIDPRDALIAYFFKGKLFSIKTDYVPGSKICKGQALIEIFGSIGSDGNIKEDLLELEMHSSYHTLKPGDSIKFTEIWNVIDYGACKCPKRRVKFLNKIFRLPDYNIE